MQPFHQGQLDVFCAIYAVLNGLRLVRNIRPLVARDILHDTLLDLAARPEAFRKVLHQQTDYYDLVDALLEKHVRKWHVKVAAPFPERQAPPVSAHVLWNCLAHWLSLWPPRAVLLRFVRFLPFDGRPFIHHWTCSGAVQGNTLRLFDSSLAEGALHTLEREQVITDASAVACDKVLIEPSSLRLLSIE